MSGRRQYPDADRMAALEWIDANVDDAIDVFAAQMALVMCVYAYECGVLDSEVQKMVDAAPAAFPFTLDLNVIPGVRGKRGVRSSAADRMWRRTIERASGCIEFTGAVDGHGYGQVRDMDRGRPIKAHRLAWESRVGPIPDDMAVLHKCDNRRCVKVDHLFLGTIAENNRDMCAKGRHANQQRSHCRNGHEFIDGNYRIERTPNGVSRRCLVCARESTRRSRARKAALR